MKMVARPHRTLLAGLFVGMVVMGTAAVTLASEHVINIPTGASEAMRPFTTKAITNGLLTGAYFYFVEVDLSVGNAFQLLGIRIIHQPTC